MTTPLGRKIVDLIEVNGPMSVADYFSLCLSDPDHGYYRTRDPFGSAGDFTTAPEISQLFGELVGIFMILAWQAHERPRDVRLVEIGPGRGTLMADAQRVIADLAPDLAATVTIHMVETSESLSAIQRKTLDRISPSTTWHTNLNTVPPGFTLLIANEFFDALPIRQFVSTSDGFRERVVSVDEDGSLAFAAGVAGLDPQARPEEVNAQPGAILEVSPARDAVMAQIAARLAADGGVALAIDYGHLQTGLGDTLQAIRNHAYEDVLANPGEADLTSHVDFQSLTTAARAQGVTVAKPLTQGAFLLGLGLLERAGALGAGKSGDVQDAIRQAVERLAGTGENQMGSLFKALCVSAKEVPIPPFETAD